MGAWAFYEHRQSQTEQQKKNEETSFLNQIKFKDLKAFRIIKGSKQLEVVQENKTWVLKKPIQDLASWTEISRWFDELQNQKVQKIQSEGDVLWKDYYLDNAPSVEMELNSGEKFSFSVSKKSSFDGKYFIKSDEELLLGEHYFFSEVNEKDFDSFRRKKILPPLGHASKIQFHGKSSFTFHWTDYKWSLDQSKAFPLDSSRLDGFWTDINSLTASFIKEAVTASSIKKYKLHKPQLKITLSYPNKDKKYLLQLSPFQNDKAYVSISHRNFILEISKESAEKLILSRDDIRDHNFPFNYDKSSAVQIERKNEKNSFSVKKVKESWQSLLPENETVDSEKVEELLDKIKELKGEKYKSDSAQKSLRSIAIKNADGQVIFELKEVSTGNARSWVKSSLWKELTEVSKSSLNEIFTLDIFLSANPSQTKKEETQKPFE